MTVSELISSLKKLDSTKTVLIAVDYRKDKIFDISEDEDKNIVLEN